MIQLDHNYSKHYWSKNYINSAIIVLQRSIVMIGAGLSEPYIGIVD